MTRCGLSEADEKHIMLLLMEGDLSDVNIESSDDEENKITPPTIDPGLSAEDMINNEMNSSDDRIFQIANQMYVEIETKSKENDNYVNGCSADAGEAGDSEDDIPLAQLLGPKVQLSKPKKQIKFLRWEKKDIQNVDSNCEVSFTKSNNIKSPLEYYKLFFDDDLINNIVDQTNLYSVQKHGVSVNTTFSEICNFFGIHIISGIVPMPSYKMYGAQHTRYSPIADVMARNRFEKLCSNLHINNNDNMKKRGDSDYDKLFKVRPFIETIKNNFSKRPATSREHSPLSREGTPIIRGKRPTIPNPIDDIRFDEKAHWPNHIEPKQRCRECKNYTRMACEKCKVPLCITKDRNCYVKFHKP